MKTELFLLTGLVLSFAAAAASVAEGKLKPTVGGLSQGKYPSRRGPAGVDWRTPWMPVALKTLVTASIGLILSANLSRCNFWDQLIYPITVAVPLSVSIRMSLATIFPLTARSPINAHCWRIGATNRSPV